MLAHLKIRHKCSHHGLSRIAVDEVGNLWHNVMRRVLFGHSSLLQLKTVSVSIKYNYQVTFDFVSFLIFLISFFSWRSIFSFHCFLLSSFLFRNPVRNSFRAFSSKTTLKIIQMTTTESMICNTFVFVFLFIGFLGTVFSVPMPQFWNASLPKPALLKIKFIERFMLHIKYNVGVKDLCLWTMKMHYHAMIYCVKHTLNHVM